MGVCGRTCFLCVVRCWGGTEKRYTETCINASLVRSMAESKCEWVWGGLGE